ncbi:hypothetical protein ANCCAN_10048 [Ancylostoma caninum]|uniref:Uncharacterized protein n=1 Tax=Ancylostoma caninum TaxID=29170 RepID=A0A368GHT1_ANCCA|nr:hypothetical protein ANCCAN_10048 [Ancylostoma caninum]
MVGFGRFTAQHNTSGRFLIIPKPYGVSCVGEPQKEGGVFENSVYNREDSDVIPMKKLADRSVTISECIPGLARVFNELGLTFCTGLERTTKTKLPWRVAFIIRGSSMLHLCQLRSRNAV